MKVPASDSLTARFALIAALALAMMIPLNMVDYLVYERTGYYQSALSDIANAWGGNQTLGGVALIVPFRIRHSTVQTVPDPSGATTQRLQNVLVERHLVSLPVSLDYTMDLRHETRRRGIYEAVVYQAGLTITGEITRPDFSQLGIDIDSVDFAHAWLAIGISDTRAIRRVTAATVGNQAREIMPGTRLPALMSTGVHIPLNLADDAGEAIPFDIQLDLNGSGGIGFTPVGGTTTARVTADWPHPKFRGNLLPTAAEISADGFSAQWEVPRLARSYPQTWQQEIERYSLEELQAGVDLFEPVYLYSMVTRAVKYGLLFVVLTFFTFVIFELGAQTRMHFVQYALVGCALVVFFLVLLSIAEHAGFVLAYLLAATLAVAMISSYVAIAVASRRRGATVAAGLGGLYAALYVLLQLEDFALLFGTGLLVAVLAVLMVLTRNINPREPVAGLANAN
ncbi:MAG: cell envelope integrity protein CreD [Gammaproteobacteria bacterium]|nr:cell envelope integrity protein CreD [Gammaproteobacteria bacterium]